MIRKGLGWMLVSVALLTAGVARAQQGAEGAPMGMSEADMQKMMELVTPGEMHKKLARGVGDWKTTMKMFVMPGEPQVSEGTAHGEMLHGGRYLQMKHTGTFMGQPFEGTGIDGYDNAKKQFVSVWIDNMGTGIMQMTGKATEDGAVYEGTMYDPMLGRDSNIRQQIRWLSDDKFVFEMWGDMPAPDGTVSNQKMMEMTAERVK